MVYKCGKDVTYLADGAGKIKNCEVGSPIILYKKYAITQWLVDPGNSHDTDWMLCPSYRIGKWMGIASHPC